MMTSYQLYIELTKQAHWAKQARRVRFAAARYYTGVDTKKDIQDDLRATKWAGKAKMIVDLR